MTEQPQSSPVWRVALCASLARPHDQILCIARSAFEMRVLEEQPSFIRWVSPRSDCIPTLSVLPPELFPLKTRPYNGDLSEVLSGECLSGQTIVGYKELSQASDLVEKMATGFCLSTAKERCWYGETYQEPVTDWSQVTLFLSSLMTSPKTEDGPWTVTAGPAPDLAKRLKNLDYTKLTTELETELKNRAYPSNTLNAARAGWYAAVSVLERIQRGEYPDE